RFQSMLGDRFGQGGHLPTSSELGFDMTQSIFEVGVAQRIEELEEALEDLDPEELLEILETQAEVFIGLAESLDLPGFGNIATTVLTAIEDNPEQVLEIAPVALADYKAAQAVVLAGDRTQGGEPSLALQQFCYLENNTSKQQQLSTVVESSLENQVSQIEENELIQTANYIPSNVIVSDHTQTSDLTHFTNPAPVNDDNTPNIFQQVWTFLTRTIRQATTRQQKSAEIQPSKGNTDSISPPKIISSSRETLEESSSTSSNTSKNAGKHSVFDDFELDDVALPDLSLFNPSLDESYKRPTAEIHRANQETIENISVLTSSTKNQRNPLSSPVSSSPKLTTPTAQLPNRNSSVRDANSAANNASIRMTVGNLDQLSQSMGELLTHHNRLALYNEQLTVLTKTLLGRISQQRNQLNQPTPDEAAPNQPIPNQLVPQSDSLLSQDSFAHFDALELDQYSDIQLLVQSFLEETAQQSESVEAIELFVTRSAQILSKQKQLLASTRKTLLNVRMLPLETILKRFSPAIERLKAQHKKQVTLTLIGSGVLVDKVIVDKLYDPLLHLVRNAFDHGIESPAERQKHNKSAVGNIIIEARQQGRHLVIDVKDDGQGLNLEKIRQKAIDTQLIEVSEAAALTSDQTIDLLFEAGFSTADEIDDLSGRGVGLDAVQAQVRSLQGWISVSHEPGSGTCFSLQIPSSLTIGKLLLCQAQGRTYAMMADAIEHIAIPTKEQVRVWEDRKTLTWQTDKAEHLVPVHSLTEVLQYATPVSDHQPLATQHNTESNFLPPVILLNYQNALVGIEVDQLLGEQELVINTLGTAIVPPAYLYGSSILPDGRLTVVLDGTMLAKIVLEQRSKQSIQHNLKNSSDIRLEQSSVQSKSPTDSSQSGATKSLQRLILTVDDSITVRNTLVEALQKSGHKVIQARDGVEALQQLKRYPDVAAILCDIEMPRMNGFEFLKARQQLPKVATIPTIMLTSREGSKHRLLTKELGATAYLTKPYLVPQLLKTVAEVIENQSVSASQPSNK
ncbi:MAG: response regulator, partial [Cyanobacteria bacterium J06650_10]